MGKKGKTKEKENKCRKGGAEEKWNRIIIGEEGSIGRK